MIDALAEPEATRAEPVRSARMEALRLGRPLSGRELGLAWAALAILAVLAFTPHIRHGGFYLDDWSNAAGALHPPGGPGIGNVLSYFDEITVYRPVLVVYVPLTYLVFGMNMGLHLAWAAALAVIVAAILYGLLRSLGVPWVHALLIAALVLLFPWFDSTRFWATADQVSLAIAFLLGGMWVAIAGLARRSWRWHAGAALLYLTSILTYEVTLPVIAAAGLLYVWRAGWRLGRARWAVDLGVAIAGGIWVGTHTSRTASGISGDIGHLREIVEGGARIVGRSAIPVGTERNSLALIALGVVFVLGLVALLALPRRFPVRSGWGLRSWLLLGAGGLALAVLGWVMFIPADPYYTPVIWGITNRVNGLSGIGAVIVVYAALGVVGTLAGQLWRGIGGVPLAITLLLALLLGAGYVTVLRRHTGIWNSAYASEAAALDQIQSRYPRLPPETTLFVSGYPAYQTLGVPILSSTWDLDGMVKTRYEDRTLAAYPVVFGFTLVCRATGVGLEGDGAPVGTAPYGTARLLDLGKGESSLPRDQRQCDSVAGDYLPGPFYLSVEY